MKSWLGLVGLAVIATACSAPLGNGASSTNADTATPAFDPDYEAFTSRADAEAFVNQHLDDLFDKPLPADDARTIRAQAALDKHWPAIVAKFHPNYPEPIVFVVDDDATVNAMAMFDWHTDQAFNIIEVYSGLMNVASDTDLEQTLLHETGHLTMKNGIERYQEALDKYWLADPNAEGVGLAIPNDPNAQATISPYLLMTTAVGRYDAPELHGLVFDPIAGMNVFFGNYEAAHTDASNPDCAALDGQIDAAHKLVVQATSPFDDLTHLTAETSAALEAAATQAETTAFSCLKPAPDVDLDGAMAQLFGQPVGSFGQGQPDDEVAAWKGKDALTGLFAFASYIDAKQRAVEAGADFPRYREYTSEEQADDFALTMLAFEGTDPSLMDAQFIDFVLDPTYHAQCVAILAAGTVPPYGLTDPHHGNCYRAFHARQFAQYMASGGTGVVIPNIPKPIAASMAPTKKPGQAQKARRNSTF